MKGIRKLFLGLVLLTLFGVGFKVDVKAATTVTLNSPTVESNLDYTQSTDGTAITATGAFNYGNTTDDWPAQLTLDPNYIYFKFQMQTGNTVVGTEEHGGVKWVCLKTTSTGSHFIASGVSKAASKTAVDDESTPVDSAGSIPISVQATKAEVVSAMTSRTEDHPIKFHFVRDSETGNPSIASQASTGDGTSVMCKVTVAGTDNGTSQQTINGVTFAIEGGTSQTESAFPYKYMLPGESAAVSITVTRNNTYTRNTKLDSWVAPTGGSVVVSNGNTSLAEGGIGCTARLAPGSTTAGYALLKYVSGNITLTGMSTISTPGQQSGTLGFQNNYAGEDIYEVYVGSQGSTTRATSWERSGNALTFAVPSLSNGTRYVYLRTKDDNWFEYNFTVSNTATISSPIKVTQGLSIPLYPLYVTTDTTLNSVEPKNGTNYISVTGTRPGVASAIRVKGENTTDSEKTGITINGSDYNVMVYASPSLKLKTSSSSSSSSGAKLFEVKMPKSVYHDNVAWDSYDSFAIYYNNKDYHVYDIEDKDKATEYVDVKQFTKDVKDAMDGENEAKISFIAYPVKGETVDKGAPSNEIKKKVYKIKLDGDAGANYKINGKDMEEYFYAIDGVDYKIEASPKNGYTSTIEKWEGVSFNTNTSGTTSFDEHKTIKAYFRSGSSSSSSSGRSTALNGEGSGSGDDYDDVPKTGESKTDIWILWSVLFISILGAGFMIWKRFGLARAIAEADAQVAHAEYEEQVKAAEKEKKDKLNMLKDLRNL